MTLNEELTRVRKECKGKIEYLRLCMEGYIGNYSDSKNIPIALIGIRDKENNLIRCTMPLINAFGLLNEDYSIQCLEDKLKDQEATYKSCYYEGSASGPFWNLEIHSGEYKGMNYTFEDFTDL